METLTRKKSNTNIGILLLLCLILIIVGIVNLFSVATPRGIESQYHSQQVIWVIIGILICSFFVVVDYKKLETLSYPLYLVCIILLVAVLLFGKTAMGAKRWLDFGIFQIQPAEITKIAIILSISKYFSDKKEVYESWPIYKLHVPMILVLLPFILIIKQPDLGTALILLLIGGFIIIFNRIKISHFIFMLLAGVGFSLLAWYKFLKPYQKKRIIAFLNPESDVLGSAYHSIQSIIAVGSGQMFGKGYMKSTQSQFSFLPEQHTDFVFSIFAEEWGFVGSLVIIIICISILFLILKISSLSNDIFAKNVSFGAFAYFFLHFSINIGMLLGLLPVVGVTFPFLSYGGSSLVSSMILISIVINVGVRTGKHE
ncbi:MAG: rod shape-determining protein RodA [Deltaproteobacteria bacterium]|nr:rod shape-determining protein RodA [Deltaproteobacteria bacterium]